MFKEHIETTAFQKMPIRSCDYQATLEAQHGAQMPIEDDNVPPTNFQRLDSGVRTRGSEVKARGTEMAKNEELVFVDISEAKKKVL